MSTRLKKLDSYDRESLTGLAKRCDWFINKNQVISNNILNPRTIFLTAYTGNEGIKHLATILDKIPSKFVLIIASEDYTFPSGRGDFRHKIYANVQDPVNFIINHSKVIHIFVENLDTIHKKLTPIPLGIHPSFENYYTNIFNSKIVINNNKDILAFCCNRIHVKASSGWKEQFLDRENVSSLALSEWKNFVKYENSLPLDEFKNILLRSKFTICVHGGGLDPSPRAWEALLCGSIPIIQHSTLDEAYSRFPVFYIDEWKEDAINEEVLNNWWDKNYALIDRKKLLEMLSMDYWWNIISSDLPDIKV